MTNTTTTTTSATTYRELRDYAINMARSARFGRVVYRDGSAFFFNGVNADNSNLIAVANCYCNDDDELNSIIDLYSIEQEDVPAPVNCVFVDYVELFNGWDEMFRSLNGFIEILETDDGPCYWAKADDDLAINHIADLVSRHDYYNALMEGAKKLEQGGYAERAAAARAAARRYA